MNAKERYDKFRNEYDKECDETFYVGDKNDWEIEKLDLALFGAHAKAIWIEEEIEKANDEERVIMLKEMLKELSTKVSTLNWEYLKIINEI